MWRIVLDALRAVGPPVIVAALVATGLAAAVAERLCGDAIRAAGL